MTFEYKTSRENQSINPGILKTTLYDPASPLLVTKVNDPTTAALNPRHLIAFCSRGLASFGLGMF